MKKYNLPSNDSLINLQFLIENKKSIIKEIGEDDYNKVKKDVWEKEQVRIKLDKKHYIYKRVEQPDDFSNNKIISDLSLNKKNYIDAWGESRYNELKKSIWDNMKKGEK